MDKTSALSLHLFLWTIAHSVLLTTAQHATCQIDHQTFAYCRDLRYFQPMSKAIKELNIYCSNRYQARLRDPCNSTSPLPTIERGWIQSMPYLETIKIENCPYTDLPYQAFANLGRLHTLMLVNLSLSRLKRDALLNSYNLRKLRLDTLPCMDVDPSLLYRQRRLTDITLQDTRLSGISVRQLISNVRSTLTHFEWTKNLMPVTIPLHMFQRFQRLTMVDLRNNHLSDAIFLAETEVETLILSGNTDIASPGPLDFSNYRALAKTTFLDLSYLNLRSLTPNAFRPLKNLKTLLLSHNLLKFIPHTLFSNMRRLMLLDLRNNRLRTFPQELEFLLKRTRDNKKFTLKLQNNRLHCNCELAWLIKVSYFETFSPLVCTTGIKAKLNQALLINLRLADLRCKPPVPPVVDIVLYGALPSNNSRNQYPNIHQGTELSVRKLTQDGTVTLDAGQSVTLRCRSQGDPPPLMMWEVQNGDYSMQRRPSLNGAQRFNEIELRFKQKDLRFDRYIIMCHAVSYSTEHKLSVTINNIAPKGIPSSRAPPRSPSSGSWGREELQLQPPHQRRHHRQQGRGRGRDRGRGWGQATPTVGAVGRKRPNLVVMTANGTEPSYHSRLHASGLQVTSLWHGIVLLTWLLLAR